MTKDTVPDLLRAELKRRGYDGLYAEGSCACKLDDLCPCGELYIDCRPGVFTDGPCANCEGGKPCDFHIGPGHEKEPEDGSDDICPCGDVDCNRPFGHEKEPQESHKLYKVEQLKTDGWRELDCHTSDNTMILDMLRLVRAGRVGDGESYTFKDGSTCRGVSLERRP